MQGVDIAATATSSWSCVGENNTTCSAVAASLQSPCPCIPRVPKPSSRIESSSHHPRLLTSDHLLLWTTPAGLQWQKELKAKLPDFLIFKLFQVMIRSLDQDTRSNYGAGLLCFTQYCDSCNIPEGDHMPTSESLISTFTALHAATASDKTLNNWLVSLHFWHIVNNTTWHGADMLRAVK
ncbi:hypothetical protein PAXRUDRAFT_164679 [Paxillus rubicundulus Ve08.2h10]|uniref:Uncharacterized protein n=1 Tax=Paxillus rubicundulus Ve08.2h10 TaxID=930991 RepID=A0A0D0DJ71_9AGAM|nr:hypothetical protein PAXRUDRAFT_164679 [Paxillus rubicundulus Ve08.2h10]